jgi:hypothetical protein
MLKMLQNDKPSSLRIFNFCLFSETKMPFIWTSGRLCDFAGCEREEFFPKNINGWFWSANQVPMS